VRLRLVCWALGENALFFSKLSVDSMMTSNGVYMSPVVSRPPEVLYVLIGLCCKTVRPLLHFQVCTPHPHRQEHALQKGAMGHEREFQLQTGLARSQIAGSRVLRAGSLVDTRRVRLGCIRIVAGRSGTQLYNSSLSLCALCRVRQCSRSQFASSRGMPGSSSQDLNLQKMSLLVKRITMWRTRCSTRT